MADGWIEWGCGACPVEIGARVRVVFRGEKVSESPRDGGLAEYLLWDHDGGYGDIVAYQVVTSAPANDNLTPRALFDAASPLQEELAINIAAQICSGVRPDAVQVLEWANALYEAEVGDA